MFLLVACQHASGMCQSHFCLVVSLRKVPRKYVELSPNTPPFLTLRFHEKDLTPTPNLLQIRPILPPLGHILSVAALNSDPHDVAILQQQRTSSEQSEIVGNTNINNENQE